MAREISVKIKRCEVREDGSHSPSVKKTKKVELDLDAIDWDLIPKWASKILVSERKYKDNMDVQIGDRNSNIDYQNIIRTHYIRPDHTRPAKNIDDKFGGGEFNYVLKNVPTKNKIYNRPVKSKTK